MKSLAVIVLIVILWAAGLLAFGARVAGLTPAAEPLNSDGVVALTGASSVRIEAAVQLLEAGKGKRLLVSGVNKGVTRKDMREVAHDYGRAFDCCVDLGFQASDTQGNAKEISSWARYHHYKTLIVVTADYHMPRSILELRAALPEAILRPYPVVTSTLDARAWWKTSEGSKRMAFEYCKYLVILVREGVLRLGAKRETLVETPQPAASTNANAAGAAS